MYSVGTSTWHLKSTHGGMTNSIKQVAHQLLLTAQIDLLMVSFNFKPSGNMVFCALPQSIALG